MIRGDDGLSFQVMQPKIETYRQLVMADPAVRDIVGGRAGAYENALADARKIAMEDMESAAAKLGANAVIGIDLDYEVLGQNNGMLMVSVSGTAVVVE